MFNTINPEIVSLNLPKLEKVNIPPPATTPTPREYVSDNTTCGDGYTGKLVWLDESNKIVCTPIQKNPKEEQCKASGKNWRSNVDPTTGGQCY